MASAIISLPRIDEDGYYCGSVSCMKDADGNLLLGAGAVNTTPPDDDGAHFYLLNATLDGWTAEAFPTTAAECVGITVAHTSRTARSAKLRALMAALVAADADNYRLARDADTLALTVEKIPETVQTAEEIQAERTAALQAMMDEEAQKYRYDDIGSACSYYNSTIEKFRTEAVAFSAWRDNVWDYGYTILAECVAGTRTIPTNEEIVEEVLAKYPAPTFDTEDTSTDTTTEETAE